VAAESDPLSGFSSFRRPCRAASSAPSTEQALSKAFTRSYGIAPGRHRREHRRG
jgi:hypothetical protein